MVNIEKFENLPYFEGRGRKYHNFWGCGKSDYHDTDHISPWTRIDRILNHYIGKSFDEAFSYYCKQVPKYQQKIFLEQFDTNRYRYKYGFYIDNNKNIQYCPKEYHKTISLSSKDCVIQMQHWKTGHAKEDFRAVYEQIKYSAKSYYSSITKRFTIEEYTKNGKFLYYEYGFDKPMYQRYRCQESSFVPVVISGWIKYFESKNDPEFQRIYQESRKAKDKTRRDLKKYKKDWDTILKDGTIRIIDFKRKQQEEIKKQKLINSQTIERLGFDEETSFKTVR